LLLWRYSFLWRWLRPKGHFDQRVTGLRATGQGATDQRVTFGFGFSGLAKEIVLLVLIRQKNCGVGTDPATVKADLKNRGEKLS